MGHKNLTLNCKLRVFRVTPHSNKTLKQEIFNYYSSKCNLKASRTVLEGFLFKMLFRRSI